jgi:hypothetical protein
MSHTELLPEGLVILPSGIAPGPAGVGSGHPTSPSAHLVKPTAVCLGGEVAKPTRAYRLDKMVDELEKLRDMGDSIIRHETGSDEPSDGEPFHIEPPASSVWASSRSAVRSDTGEVAWLLTPKAISHLFGSRVPPYRRVDEILALRVQGISEHEPDGSAKP